jgi:hypothetical protein
LRVKFCDLALPYKFHNLDKKAVKVVVVVVVLVVVVVVAAVAVFSHI